MLHFETGSQREPGTLQPFSTSPLTLNVPRSLEKIIHLVFRVVFFTSRAYDNCKKPTKSDQFGRKHHLPQLLTWRQQEV